MAPVLITLGQLQIRSYDALLALASLAGLGAGWIEAKRCGYLNVRNVILFVLTAPPGAALGWVAGGLFDPNFYRALQYSRFVFRPGFVSFGFVLGALAWGFVYAKLVRKPAGRTLDMVALILPLMLGITRIGCLLNGCCYGRPAQGFGTVFLPGDFGDWGNRYPTQPALAVFDLALFAWLWIRRQTKPHEGSLTVSFLLCFSAGRMIIDGYRDLPDLLGGLSFQQLASMAIFIIAAIAALKLRAANRAPRGEPDRRAAGP